MFPDKSYFTGRPTITLHTRKTKSAIRAAIRDRSTLMEIIKDVTDKERSEWYNYVDEGLSRIDRLK